jgi:Ca-activated chloride channel family protein
MLAGFIGGIIGGIICVTLESTILGILSEIMLGLVIGLAISWVEEALREAWLTVVWGPKETTTISLGAKSVVFGSSREADVYLPRRRGEPEIPPVRAVVGIEGGRVILDDRSNGTRRELHNGETADFGRVSIIVNIKKGS